MANDLLVRILGDSRSIERAFKRASKSASTFGGDMDKSSKKFGSFAKGAAAGLGVAFGAGTGIAVIRKTVDEASNLNEQLSRTRQVFELSAESVIAWSTTTARSMGIAQSAALDAAGTFGAMFDQAGQSSVEAARLSKTVVQLAADLASFSNTSVDEALTALRSGLSGEIEPLRRFQVFLTEAAVAQQAMADTGKTSSKELTQGEKILARYALILKQTGKQQGDFARTSGSLANQQRILAASVKELQANLGTTLLPAITKVTEALVDATGYATGFVDALQKLSDVKIPPIEIPMVVKFGGGGTFGGFAGRVASATPENVPTFGPIIRAWTALLKAGFQKDADAAAPDLAESFRQSLDDLMTNALTAAAASVGTTVRPPLGPGARFAQLPGVDFSGFVGTVSPDVAARNREVLAQARGQLNEALEIQVKRREGLKRMLDAAIANGATQKRIDDLAERYARSQADVIGTQKSIAANAKAAAAAAKATAEATAEKAAADKKAAAERAAELRQAQIAAEQIRQFRALGLDKTGAKPPPTIQNLLRQITQVGQHDLTKTQRGVLARIRKVLVDPLHKATAETRAAAKGLIDGIRDALDIDKAVGPLTKTTSLNAGKILEGLGLGRDLEKELRARLSSFNSAGRALAGAQTRTTGGFRGGITTGIVVENHNTINLDGDTVARNVTKSQQGTRRRNPSQKRGRRSGI